MRRRRLVELAGRLVLGRGQRQHHAHRRTLADPAADDDAAARLAREAERHREAEAAAEAEAFGREEGFEDPRQRFLVHAAAVVDDFDQHVVARRHLEGRRLVALQADGAGHDAQAAAFRHRVAGVQREIEQRAFELPWSTSA